MLYLDFAKITVLLQRAAKTSGVLGVICIFEPRTSLDASQYSLVISEKGITKDFTV